MTWVVLVLIVLLGWALGFVFYEDIDRWLHHREEER